MRNSSVLFLFPILFYSVCLCNHVFVVSGFCSEDQQSILLKFKSELGFDNDERSSLRSWNRSIPCSEWSGVHWDEEGHVTCLDLSGDLRFNVGLDNSSALFNLQYLRYLNLAYNDFFNSTIPPLIKNLKNLTYLNLSYAGFVGQIPVEISQLTRLVTLDLSSYFFSFLKLEDPDLQKLVQNLTSIKQLHLDGVIISTKGHEWSNALLALIHLEELSMSRCNLSGPIDSSLAGLENLTKIYFDGNNFSSIVLETFAKFKSLSILSLRFCNLRGVFPSRIFQVRKLSFIDISNNYDLHGSLSEISFNGALQTLKASYTSFSGVIPDSIGNLRHLSEMDLSGCKLNGTLPNSIANLTKLRHLDLSNNSFISPIPSSLFTLPLLKEIRLSFNNFDGRIDEFTTLPSSTLNTLDLSNNQLEGPIPMSIFKLNELQDLQLSSNKFSGMMKLDMFQSLRNLMTLDISYNNLSIDASMRDTNLSTFPNLKSLNLASCKLREFPMFMRNHSSLTFLDLSNNQIQGLIPHWIWNLHLVNLDLSNNFLRGFEGSLLNLTTKLYAVDFHSNQLQGQIPDFVIGSIIFYLDYSSNNFNYTVPSNIGHSLSSTLFFSLSENNFHGSIPHSLCNATYLEALDLSNNKIEGIIPRCLTHNKHLRVLDLGNNMLSGKIPDTFSKPCTLSTFDLNRNKLSGLIPKSLANCKSLEVLDLGNNQIEGPFLCSLMKISTLRVMVLHTNKLQGSLECLNANGALPVLQIVDISFNNFSGLIPSKALTTWEAMMHVVLESKQIKFLELIYIESSRKKYYQDSVEVTSKGQEMKFVKILTFLTSIDFSSNNFEGPIPRELMNLRGLHVLNLSNNALSGQIPSSIENLQQLESLDLSSNSLIGEIPPQLASLFFLEFLNLSSNHLVGRIPTGTQLQSFNASSFQGNDGLYGPPLTSNDHKHEPLLLPSPRNHHTVDLKFITSMEWGVVFGLGIIIGPIFFWKRWVTILETYGQHSLQHLSSIVS